MSLPARNYPKMEGEQVYSCNICDEGFDTEEEIENDIVKYHKEIIIQISEDLEEEAEITLDESYGESWLAKFDNDGNLID